MQCVYTEAVSPDGLPIGGLYGMLASVLKFLVRNPDHDSVVFAVDAGIPAWRFQETPEYKGQRAAKRSPQDEENHKNARLQVPHVRKVTRWLGCGFARAEGYEGDDTIAALALQRFADRRVTVFSSDKDFTELVDDRVRVYDAISEEWREPNPTYLLERILDPKESDNLDGPAGVGKVGAARLLAVYRRIHEAALPTVPLTGKAAVEGLLGMCRNVVDTGLAPKADKEMKAVHKVCSLVVPYADKVRANWRTMCLHRIARACDAETVLRVSPHDMEKFAAVTREYGLTPVRQDMPAYGRVFGRLDHSWMVPSAPQAV